MDMQISSVQVSYTLFAKLVLYAILFYPLLFVGTSLARSRRSAPLPADVVFHLAVPTFLGLAGSWSGVHNLLRGIRLSGGGPASRAAGAAEAQYPLFFGAITSVALGAFVLVLALRSSESRPAEKDFRFAFAATTAVIVLVVSQLWLSYSGLVGYSARPTAIVGGIVAFACLGIALLGTAMMFRARTRAEASWRSIGVAIALHSAVVLAVWYCIRAWQIVAITAA